MNVKKRLKIFICQMNISESSFYKGIQVSSNYLDKDGAISTDILIVILNLYPTLSYKWLLFGEGGMTEIIEELNTKISCDDANCLKNYAIKLQKDKINRLEKVGINDNTYTNSYNLN